jgi:hypothetical protein
MPKCKECGAEIKWIELYNGKKMPVNTPGTSLVYTDKKTGKGRVVTSYTPHWATCTKPDLFRREKS